MQQRFWDDLPTAEPPRPRQPRASRRERVEATTLPLWSDPPTPAEADPAAPDAAPPPPPREADHPPRRPPRRPAPELSPGQSAEPTASPRPAPPTPPAPERARSTRASLSPAPKPRPAGPRLGPPPSAPGARARGGPAGRADASPDDEPGMGEAAEWVEAVLEAGGAAASAVRAFADAFPPVATWGEPWAAELPTAEAPQPFSPAPTSYAAALREVLAGRRRVRIAGRWADGTRGAVVAQLGRAGQPWSLTDVEGPDAPE